MKILLNQKIQNVLFAGLSATLFTACGGSSSYNTSYITDSGEKLVLGIDNPICQQGDAKQEGKLVDAVSKKGVSNATVEIAGCEVSTDEKGFYSFSNIPSSSRVSVNFKKDGYVQHSEIIQIKDNGSNYLKTTLNKNTLHWSYESQSGTQNDMIAIDPDTTYTEDENIDYSGEVNLYFTYKDTTTPEGRDMFPGTYRGKDSNGVIVSLKSYGLMFVTLENKDNKLLNISKPIKISINNSQGLKDESIPLWYYNEDQGIWVQEGHAQSDDNGNYICDIPFTGTWSLNKPIETEMGIYKGKIVDANENPLSNVRVEVKGQNWVGKDLTTDENGDFTVSVVPNKPFKLYAYNYEEKFAASYPSQLKGIASGDVFTD